MIVVHHTLWSMHHTGRVAARRMITADAGFMSLAGLA